MNSVVCTLFEGHYHYGVASLVNSLIAKGFKGDFYAGYKGDLPLWTKKNKIELCIGWRGSQTIQVSDDCRLHLLPLDTDYHLTNYKPDFMLRLLDGPAKKAGGILYFDPDIVVDAPWSFFENWITCGVALCEDVNSPLTRNHPTRIAWREYFFKYGHVLTFKDSIYVNGGFAGVNKKDRNFLEVWKKLQEAMAEAIGGLNRSIFTTNDLRLSKKIQGPFSPFGKTDQDALNAAVEAWEGEVSLITKEGMGFSPGLTVMPHALGQPKPWKWKFIQQALKGRAPRAVDRKYWESCNGSLKVHSRSYLKLKNISILFAIFLSRFYKK